VVKDVTSGLENEPTSMDLTDAEIMKAAEDAADAAIVRFEDSPAAAGASSGSAGLSAEQIAAEAETEASNAIQAFIAAQQAVAAMPNIRTIPSVEYHPKPVAVVPAAARAPAPAAAADASTAADGPAHSAVASDFALGDIDEDDDSTQYADFGSNVDEAVSVAAVAAEASSAKVDFAADFAVPAEAAGAEAGAKASEWTPLNIAGVTALGALGGLVMAWCGVYLYRRRGFVYESKDKSASAMEVETVADKV
jgi:hypothetical protein